MLFNIFCKKHPRYTGKRKPTSDCLACSSLYIMKPSTYTPYIWASLADGSIIVQKEIKRKK